MNRFFLSILLVGSSLVFGIFVLWPRLEAFSIVWQEFRAKKTELENRENYFNHLKDLADRLEDSKDLVGKIDAVLPNDPQLPSLYEFLQKLSAGSGLVMRSIAVSPLPATAGSRVKPIDVALQLGGSYENMKAFLSNLLQASRMADIQSLHFSTPSEGKNFVFTMHVNSYSY